ncbi:MAG: D-alanyl-D-alanine carboxypeptidase family protein [Lachnospiraceae bacterium]
MKTLLCYLCSFTLLLPMALPTVVPATAQQTDAPTVSAPSAVLIEASTGTVLYEKEAHQVLRPASITKIMTLILIFDALASGKIKLTDTATTSEYAASMGGSQVFLEAGETQTIDTLIKCICVASANDACVTMAEHIFGSEEAFVNAMNKRAKGLGMNDTHFCNCCGLDTDDHVTSAWDVALMSRELMNKYPQIQKYTTIWMEDITHHTARGEKPFTLSNTNKLIRQYQNANGLKTGSTSLAKFCVSAAAKKDGIQLIAVIMKAPDPKGRFQDARTLLDYGFSHCQFYTDKTPLKLPLLPVKRSTIDAVPITYEKKFQYVDTSGSDLSSIDRKLKLDTSITAPVKKGTPVGTCTYYLKGKKIGSVRILAAQNAKQADFWHMFLQVLEEL